MQTHLICCAMWRLMRQYALVENAPTVFVWKRPLFLISTPARQGIYLSHSWRSTQNTARHSLRWIFSAYPHSLTTVTLWRLPGFLVELTTCERQWQNFRRFFTQRRLMRPEQGHVRYNR